MQTVIDGKEAEGVWVDLGVMPLAGVLPRAIDILDPLPLIELPVRRIRSAVKRPNNHPAGLKALPLQRGSTPKEGGGIKTTSRTLPSRSWTYHDDA
jgi:hypothetical protein